MLPVKRQTCSRCLQTTEDYRTDYYDQRTAAEVDEGRKLIIKRFHVCRACQAVEERDPGLQLELVDQAHDDPPALFDALAFDTSVKAWCPL